jgi:threonine/homoserine/homoserine lactone efflux protein
MAYFEHLWLFFILLVGIVIVPGMDMMFVLANALVGGRRAGAAATAGIMLGGAVHTVIGLAAVATLSHLVPTLFDMMLVAGSLYMIWVGYTLVLSRIEVDHVETTTRKPIGRIFWQGLLTCLVNPKAWLFVMSVFPQFLKPDFGPLVPQAIAMGLLCVLVQGSIYGGLALAALKSRDALVSSPSATIWIGRTAGWLLIAVATLTLWEAVH